MIVSARGSFDFRCQLRERFRSRSGVLEDEARHRRHRIPTSAFRQIGESSSRRAWLRLHPRIKRAWPRLHASDVPVAWYPPGICLFIVSGHGCVPRLVSISERIPRARILRCLFLHSVKPLLDLFSREDEFTRLERSASSSPEHFCISFRAAKWVGSSRNFARTR